MKIAFAVKSMYQTKGGAERVLALVANGLAARGHDVALLTFDAPDITPSYPLSDKVKRLFLNIGTAARPTTWQEGWRRVIMTRRILSAQKPDIVISFMYSSYVLTAIALLGTGIKLIGSEHIVPAYYRARPLHFQLLLLSVFMMNRLTVVTDHIITLFPRWVRHRLVCVPNPVVLPQPTAATKVSGRKILLNVGRMTAQKNQALLVDAFASVANDFPDWDLHIIGDGELRTTLQDHIHRLGLNDRAHLLPPTDSIENAYATADLFGMPSTFESFGLVTAEAMLCGLPAVGFADCPGTNEIIIDGVNGLLASGLSDVESFSNALRKLMADEGLRAEYGRKAKETVTKYHLAPVLDTWENCIQQVISA